MRKMYIPKDGVLLMDSTHGKSVWKKNTKIIEGKKIFSKKKLKKLGL